MNVYEIKKIREGLQWHRAGKRQAAQRCYSEVLRHNPDNSEAMHLLGLIAYELCRYEEAESLITKAIHKAPDRYVYYNNLGNVLKCLKKYDKAIACYQTSLKIKPDYAEACNNMALVYSSSGDMHKAVSLFKRALHYKKNYPEAYNNMGIAYARMGCRKEAAGCFLNALKIRPDYANAHNNIGNVYKTSGQYRKALHHYKRAILNNPDHLDALNNIGCVYRDMGKPDTARRYLIKALTINPLHIDALNNMGLLCQVEGNIDGARTYFTKILDIAPDHTGALNNIGNIYKDEAKPKKAIQYFRQALREDKCYSTAYSNLLLTMHYDPDITQQELFNEHRTWANIHQTERCEEESLYIHNRGSRLKIAYISPDFRQHSVAYFIDPVLKYHDRSKFEIHCISDVARTDDVTRRLKNYADAWCDIYGMSGDEVASVLREKEIDILVDLAGHTGNNRMQMFAAGRIAPVQITYLGYPDTTGLDTMDYRITDGTADREGIAEKFHSEKLLRIPGCFLCYGPPEKTPDPSPPPVLQNDFITFGSFNNAAKINSTVLDAWAKILQRVPGSNIALKSQQFSNSAVKNMICSAMHDRGINGERIQFLEYASNHLQHLSMYDKIDVCLDTFPYNGTTTTCEALWMGVPVVTITGVTHASRVGLSILKRTGLEYLSADSTAAYVQCAVETAQDVTRLKSLRFSMRSRMRNTLCNARSFTKLLERAYEKTWTHMARSLLRAV